MTKQRKTVGKNHIMQPDEQKHQDEKRRRRQAEIFKKGNRVKTQDRQRI